MADTTLHHADTDLEIHKVVVGPFENNVFVLRCRHTGEALLFDAANEHDRLLELARALGVRRIVETHGHWDHIQAVTAMRDAGFSVGVTTEDAAMLPSYDEILDDDTVIQVGELRVRTIHTPGHTPGSMCFVVENKPLLFSGDTLFPGGAGNTSLEGGDFTAIMASIDERLYRGLDDNTIVMPGHGLDTTIGAEKPHFDEWVDRGW
ncbi:MAG: MBL fold metallo-hydrolase [Microthrixaceae bacterium]|nr:MBL fold metallo-hydrolase [Microthrixaceae bacterium]